jgi:hypothetical protein
MAPPDLAPDRKQILRAAFQATLTDPEFLEDARKMAPELIRCPAAPSKP